MYSPPCSFGQHLSLSPGPIAVNSLAYNHNGQLLLTGAADGLLRLYGMAMLSHGTILTVKSRYVVMSNVFF